MKKLTILIFAGVLFCLGFGCSSVETDESAKNPETVIYPSWFFHPGEYYKGHKIDNNLYFASTFITDNLAESTVSPSYGAEYAQKQLADSLFNLFGMVLRLYSIKRNLDSKNKFDSFAHTAMLQLVDNDIYGARLEKRKQEHSTKLTGLIY